MRDIARREVILRRALGKFHSPTVCSWVALSATRSSLHEETSTLITFISSEDVGSPCDLPLCSKVSDSIAGMMCLAAWLSLQFLDPVCA